LGTGIALVNHHR